MYLEANVRHGGQLVDAIGMFSRERLVSLVLGASAVGLVGLSIAAFLDRVEIGRGAEALLATGGVLFTIATFRSESHRVPVRDGLARRGSSAGRVITLVVIALTVAAVAYLIFVAFEMRDFTF